MIGLERHKKILEQLVEALKGPKVFEGNLKIVKDFLTFAQDELGFDVWTNMYDHNNFNFLDYVFYLKTEYTLASQTYSKLHHVAEEMSGLDEYYTKH